MARSASEIRSIVLTIICMVVLNHAFSQGRDGLKEDWERMHGTKNSIFKDYNDLKFGMFIHWGVYSKLGGVWKGEKIVSETHGNQATLGEWVMYCAHIPRAEYREVAKTFNPVGFNADKWVKLAREAGMRYIVVMPKHHDGFAMYHSEVTDYNIYDITPFKRDPMEEIYNACKKYDIRMGIYYSHSIDWMDGGDAGISQAKRANPQMKDTLAANNWDPSPVSYRDYIENKAKPQMRELLTKFPGLIEIWYDFPRYMNREQSFEFYKLAYQYQPLCLINSRVGNDLGDMLTAGDNEIPTVVNGQYKTWETPGTINNTWGYKSYDNDWKSLNEMLFWIAEIASKGGNYLLNVGPDGNGVIPEESVKILKEIGVWMEVNGEAIYGTNRWATAKEGPTSVEMKSTGSRKENGFNCIFTSSDFWYTTKGNSVYVISLVSPEKNKVSVQSLFNYRQQIKGIKLLGSPVSLKWEASGDKVNITLSPGSNAKTHGFVLKVELNDL
ncbi:MAG: alpha-L-fucosidase [Prolixibacteraceae bacterium]|nr:alpha-L-fucosidase [Prolixibacteraceae bacterium]